MNKYSFSCLTSNSDLPPQETRAVHEHFFFGLVGYHSARPTQSSVFFQKPSPNHHHSIPGLDSGKATVIPPISGQDSMEKIREKRIKIFHFSGEVDRDFT